MASAEVIYTDSRQDSSSVHNMDSGSDEAVEAVEVVEKATTVQKPKPNQQMFCYHNSAKIQEAATENEPERIKSSHWQGFLQLVRDGSEKAEGEETFYSVCLSTVSNKSWKMYVI